MIRLLRKPISPLNGALVVKDNYNMIKLNTKAIEAIRKDTKLKGELQMILEVSSNTLYTWLKNNDSKLTQIAALDAISNKTGLTGDDLIIRN